MMFADASATTDQLKRVFQYVWSLDLPSRAEYADGLAQVGPFQAVGLFLAGIILLVYGFRYFKAIVLLDGAMIGALIGAYLGSFREGSGLMLLMGLAGGIIFGVLAWHAIKFAVGILAAIAGGLLGYAVWYLVARSIGNDAMLNHAWAGAIIGVVAIGMLAFVLFRAAVITLTAIQGSLMLVSGACSVLISRNMVPSLQGELVENEYLLCILVGVPAAAGFVYQAATEAAKIQKKRRATEKPPV